MHDRLAGWLAEELAADAVTAERIEHGERPAAHPVTGRDGALEIDTPHRVRALGLTERGGSDRRSPPTPATVTHQTMAFEDPSDRRRARELPARMPIAQPGQQRARPPTWAVPTSGEDDLDHRRARRRRARQRPARPVFERTHVVAGVAVAPDPDVAGLSANPEASAQLRHVDAPVPFLPAPLPLENEARPLTHDVRLFPRHTSSVRAHSVRALLALNDLAVQGGPGARGSGTYWSR